MLVAAAVCPHPPLLVPAVASGAAPDTETLRRASLDAVRRLTGAVPDAVVAIGGGPSAHEWDETAGGNLAGYGVNIAFGGRRRVLPLSLTIAAYLLDEVGWSANRRYVGIPADVTPVAAAQLGLQLADVADRVAFLVMGDGSAKRTDASPGYVDERAAPYDAAVVAALAKPDIDTLLGLDAATATDLWVAGRQAWQVLAGAAETAYARGASISTAVRYDEAPYGVGYFVVDWSVH